MFTLNLINMIFTWKFIITQTILTQLLVIALVFAAHTSSLKLTFTHTVYELFVSTFLLCIVNLPTILDGIEKSTENPKIPFSKFIRKVFQRIISAFVLAYVLTTFADNLLLAILGLSHTLVFIIYGVWSTIVLTYLSVLSFLCIVSEYALIKKWDDPVETTLLWKVSSRFVGNLLLFSPLILKVGNDLSPKCGFMMRVLVIVVLIIPMSCIGLLYLVYGIKGMIKSPSPVMKKPSKEELPA